MAKLKFGEVEYSLEPFASAPNTSCTYYKLPKDIINDMSFASDLFFCHDKSKPGTPEEFLFGFFNFAQGTFISVFSLDYLKTQLPDLENLFMA